MPSAMWPAVCSRLEAQVPEPKYIRVECLLTQLLEDKFLTMVQTADVSIFSEGRVGESNVFALQRGTLTLCLEQASYESFGVVGRPLKVPGAKNKRALWRIDVELEALCLPTGKKRLASFRRACSNIAVEKMQWHAAVWPKEIAWVSNAELDPLYRQLSDCLEDGSGTAAATASPVCHEVPGCSLPSFHPPEQTNSDSSDFEAYANDLLEFISLCSVQSPLLRLSSEDRSVLGQHQSPDDPAAAPSVNLTLVRWTGHLSAPWVAQLLYATLNAAQYWRSQNASSNDQSHEDSWYALSVLGFSSGPISWSGGSQERTRRSEDAYAILKLPRKDEFVSWEIVGAGDAHS